MEIKFDVKMTHKIMYNFLLNHTYRSMSGIVGILLGIVALVLYFVTKGKVEPWMSMAYLIFGVWFVLYLPVSLYLRSGKQVKNSPVFKKPITYIMNEEGITTRQDDQEAKIEWGNVQKVTQTGMSLLVYTGRRTAFVLPKESMGDQYKAAVEMLNAHVAPEYLRIRK